MPDLMDATDLRVTTLPAMPDTHELRKRLETVVPRDWGCLLDAKVQVLKAHPGSRCTFELQILAGGRWRCLVGKVYSSDCSDVYRAMQEIAAAGFGPEQEFSIPRPVAFLPDLNLVLQEFVEGKRARSVFLESDRTLRVEAAERCARWLARFQQCAPRLASEFPVEHELALQSKWSGKIDETGVWFSDIAAPLSLELEKKANSLGSAVPCASHGSYSPGQVIFSGRRTAVVDWDGCTVADPARDAGRFLIALRRLALGKLGSIHALDEAGAVFHRTYLEAAAPDAGVNLAFYAAAACLRLASYHLIHPVAGWQNKVRSLLEEGLRILEGI